MFEVGEEINPEHYSIRLRITQVSPEPVRPALRTITAEVIKSSLAYFRLGSPLYFTQNMNGDWIMDNSLPWFVLYERDGKKRFEHYR